MKIHVIAAVLSIVLAGCSSLKVVEIDPKTGYFPTQSKARIVIDKAVDLDERKSLLLLADKSSFEQGLIKNIGYFGELMTYEDLEKRIIAAGLTEKVQSIKGRIGLNNAAKYYKPFLWLRFSTDGTGRDQRAQLVLTDPITMEDYFVTETQLDYVWAGVNDQNNWYPMFNSLVDYIKKNSKTYKK